MARQRYPSDERRLKQRPHVKVHLSIRSHPKFADVFEDPEQRGIWLGLMLLGVQYHAAKTDNVVSLGIADLAWITGRTQRAPAERSLRTLCERMEWTCRTVGRRWEVTLRNLEYKQGFGYAPTPVATRDYAASEEQKNRRTEEQRVGTQGAPRTAVKPPPATWALNLSGILVDKITPITGARIPRGASTRWAREIEKLKDETPTLNRNTNYAAGQIRSGIYWAFSPANLGLEFEVVIRSGSALREKWSKLCEAKKRSKRRANGSGKPSGPKRASEFVFGSREWCAAAGIDFEAYQREQADEAARKEGTT